MASFNEITLVGNVGKAPEVRQFEENKVATFSLATTSGKGDKALTQWHNIVAWSPLAEICESYVKTGSQILVKGEIRYRSWKAQDGSTRQTTEIMARTILLLGKKESNDEPKNDLPF